MESRIALIGFGEAGRTFALAGGWASSAHVFDIKTDSDLVANQLQGTYKVKDAGLRGRHQQAMDLLDQFGAWQVEWQPREETEKLLGH